MKIKEAIERECCDYDKKDLVRLSDRNKYNNEIIDEIVSKRCIWVCKYCGSLWIDDDEEDDEFNFTNTGLTLDINNLQIESDEIKVLHENKDRYCSDRKGFYWNPFIKRWETTAEPDINFNTTIAFDGDGTIWESNYPEKPERFIEYFTSEGIKYNLGEVIRELHKNGWYIVIHSCRMTPPNNKQNQSRYIKYFLEKYNVPYHRIWGEGDKDTGKPICKYYVDNSMVEPFNVIKRLIPGWKNKV